MIDFCEIFYEIRRAHPGWESMLVKFSVNPLDISIGIAGRARARLAEFRLPLPRSLTMQDQTHHIRTFAESYLRTRVDGNAPVATREAVQAMRTKFPDCPLSDRELADMFARQAMAHGRPVIFDCCNENVDH
jgi:hypothetical protein